MEEKTLDQSIEVVNDVETAIESTEEVATKPLTMDDMKSLGQYIELESAKKNLTDKMKKMRDTSEDLKKSFSDITQVNDVIDNKLSQYDSIDALAKDLKEDQDVIDFYKDGDGNEIQINIEFDSDKKRIEFMRESLILFKTMEISHKKIDEEFEKLDQATAELNDSIKDTYDQLSDNVLAYTGYLKDKADICEDDILRRKILKNVKYIESAYNLNIYNEVLDKHPSVVDNTKRELTAYLNGNSGLVSNTGKRYIDKIMKHHIPTALTLFISTDETDDSEVVASEKPNTLSFEENFLLKEDYEYKDLFVYSIIRYFAMANFDDENIRMAHNSICLVLGKMYNRTLDAELQKKVIGEIKEYIKRYL